MAFLFEIQNQIFGTRIQVNGSAALSEVTLVVSSSRAIVYICSTKMLGSILGLKFTRVRYRFCSFSIQLTGTAGTYSLRFSGIFLFQIPGTYLKNKGPAG